MKLSVQKLLRLGGVLLVVLLIGIGFLVFQKQGMRQPKSSLLASTHLISQLPTEHIPAQPTPSPLPTPTPSPSPTPYPPAGWTCTTLPILMYHHIEPEALAKQLGHASLTVDDHIFETQMAYLQNRGYTPMYLRDLADWFDHQSALPTKPVIITVDDGYDDFYTYALPILKQFNFKSELFVPTGLLENPGYLSWGQVIESSHSQVDIAHHTWSHKNVAQSTSADFAQEIDLPTQQLKDHGFGPVDIFAYPYGTHNGIIESYLQKEGFRIAVTTLPGKIQCKEDRLALHRTRIGNAPLSSYGL